MHTFKPVKPSRISEQVVEQIKEAILKNHFKARDKLPSERKLADEFQVSRLAIHEALITLEHSGFIVIRQGSTGGAFVTDLTFENISKGFLDLFLVGKFTIREFYEVRLFIEPEIARLAALNTKPEYKKRIKEAIKAEEQPMESLSKDIDNKTLVHFILAEMCGNRLYEAFIRLLIRINRKVVEAVEPDFRHMHPAGMHHSIVEAVLAGDGETASEAMRKHAIEFGENLIAMEEEYKRKIAAGKSVS